MEIKHNYLMWIGAAHYAKITDWTDEALAQGISKRVPSIEMAKVLTQPGTVVFVAHDEGEYKDCDECKGVIENPERRKLEQERNRLTAELSNLAAEVKNIRESIALNVCDAEGGEADIARIEKLMENRRKKANKLAKDIDSMDRWIDGGTGGQVHVHAATGTSTWDYRRYNYWLHQPQHFDPSKVTLEKHMCETCGGIGRLPLGKVFGMFVPQNIEYIVGNEAKEAVTKKAKEAGAKLVTEAEVKLEAKRGCGKRRGGGVYVVTSPKGNSKNVKEAVATLVEEGKLDPQAVEINGQFAHFIRPVPIDAKRFRGIKRWNLDPDVEDEAEMIADAIDPEIEAAVERLGK